MELRSGLSSLLDLRQEWNELYLTTANRAFYNDWRWHAAIARHLIKQDLYYLLVFDDDKLVAVLPLQYVKKKKFGLVVQYLKQPSHAHVVLSDILVHSEYVDRSLMHFIKRSLRSQRQLQWHRFYFSGFAGRSNLRSLCNSGAARIKVVGKSYYANLAPDHPDYDPVSTKQIRNVRRLKARATAQFGDTRLEVVTDCEKIQGAFDEFIRVEASGWKGHRAAKSAIKLHPELISFYRELLVLFADTEQASISVLRIGEDIAASKLALHSNGSLYLLKIGYDEAYDAVGPGNFLLKEMLESCAVLFREVNLLTAPAWADRWNFKTEPVYSVSFYNGNFLALVFQCLKSFIDLFGVERKKSARARVK